MKREFTILTVLVLSFVLLTGCGSSSEADQPAQDTVDTRLTISDTMNTEHFDFSILSVSTASSVKSEVGTEYTASEGNQMVTVVFSAKNTSGDTQNVMNTNFNSYVDGTKTTVVGAVGKVDGYMPLIGAVSSEKVFEGYTIWELPQDWQELEFSYIDALTGRESEDTFVIYSSDISE